MLFDQTLLFYHTGSVYNFTAGEFVSLVGLGPTDSVTSSTINLGVPRDLGIGDGANIPRIALYVGTAITASITTLTINWQFQGATASTGPWTTYAETGPLLVGTQSGSGSFSTGSVIMPWPVPARPQGAPLPQYYQINAHMPGAAGVVSTGTVIGGIILSGQDEFARTGALYPSGFTVV